MKRRSLFVRILNALAVSAATSAAVGTAPILAIADPITLLTAADIEIPP